MDMNQAAKESIRRDAVSFMQFGNGIGISRMSDGRVEMTLPWDRVGTYITLPNNEAVREMVSALSIWVANS